MPNVFTTDTELYSGQGYVEFAQKDENGNPLGFVLAGNVDAMSPAFATAKGEKRENMTGQRGILATRINENTLNVSMDWSSWSPANLALGLRGELKTVAAAGAPIKIKRKVSPGDLIALEHLGATGIIVRDDPDVLPTPGTNVYVNDTALDGSGNYITDPERAAIKFTPALASQADQIAVDTLVEIEYVAGAQSVIETLTTNPDPVWLRYVGVNVETGRRVLADFYAFDPEPLGELALITPTDWANFSMNGTALLDSTRQTGSQFFTYKYLD